MGWERYNGLMVTEWCRSCRVEEERIARVAPALHEPS